MEKKYKTRYNIHKMELDLLKIKKISKKMIYLRGKMKKMRLKLIFIVFVFCWLNNIGYAKGNQMIGNSFYKWNIEYPKGCRILDIQPSGKSVLIQNKQNGYYYYIYTIYSNTITTNEELMDELLSYIDDEDLISKSFVESDGTIWAAIIIKNKNEISEYRATIKDKRLYQIHFYTENKNEFLDDSKNIKYKKIINSFKLEAPKNNKAVDVNKIYNGLYTYTEKQYGWKIKLTPNINVDIKNSQRQVKIIDEINGVDGGVCGVEFQKTEKGENLNNYVQKEVKNEYLIRNQKDIKIIDVKINGFSAKKICYQTNIGQTVYLLNNIYLIAGKYKYHVYVDIPKELTEGLNENIYDKMLMSFCPMEQISVEKLLKWVTATIIDKTLRFNLHYNFLYRKEEYEI